MGIGFDFGPPKRNFDPMGDWLGKRRLSAEHLAEMVRRVEARGYSVDDRSEVKVIEADCEHFEFGPTGGHLSKPSRDLDEGERQYHVACLLCEYAGWILVGEGFAFGYELRNDKYRVLFAPPMEIRDDSGPLDELRNAATRAALEKALLKLEGVVIPDDDIAIQAALLLSADESVVMQALDRLETLTVDISTVLDSRLRRLVMLSDEPAIVRRARELRGNG